MKDKTGQQTRNSGTINMVDGRSFQRAASVANLPKQIAAEWGEPKSNEVATATESAPQRTVEVGGRSPAAECNAATLWVHRRQAMSERSEEVARPARGLRQQPQVEHSRRLRTTQPAQRVAALRAAAPRAVFAARWNRNAMKGKRKCADAASSRINTANSPLGERPKGGSMVRIYVRRTQAFLCPKS